MGATVGRVECTGLLCGAGEGAKEEEEVSAAVGIGQEYGEVVGVPMTVSWGEAGTRAVVTVGREGRAAGDRGE